MDLLFLPTTGYWSPKVPHPRLPARARSGSEHPAAHPADAGIPLVDRRPSARQAADVRRILYPPPAQ